MARLTAVITFILFTGHVYSQQELIDRFLSDSSMHHASASIVVMDAETGDIVAAHNGKTSLSQASVMKLVTSAAAIELLGPDHRFTTVVGYKGTIKSRTLKGDIIIKGGGDPALGSSRFSDHYLNITGTWVKAIKEAGIRKITGNIITDDSYFDYQPVPAGWNWEDIGNYYGAGVFGLSVFDNTLELHFRTGDTGTTPLLISTNPPGAGILYENRLIASGTTDNGYVYCAPYSSSGWITGQIPASREDFVLKASIPDPPALAARMLRDSLLYAGIKVGGISESSRTMTISNINGFTEIYTTISPPLKELIVALNQESVNLYAETLVKELGKRYRGTGSTDSGRVVVLEFLDTLGVSTQGMFMEDGSGLSPQNALSSEGLARLLYLMKKRGRNYSEFYGSLPEAGKSGTLRSVFRDPVFDGNLRAKSGTLLRVKSYAGYLKTQSGKELIFSIIVNNFTCRSSAVTQKMELLLKDIALQL